MSDYKILEALEKVDVLIKKELKQFIGANSPPAKAAKEHLWEARMKVQEAITCILKNVR